jgi:16S rRNA (adenine1518-N6/adenine1519-N6)-dimethyltransferase
MAQTKHEIQALLAQIGGQPRHRFGQNFMIDGNLVRLIAQSAVIQPADLVLEIGPGTGTLTEELLARQADVLAVEIDRDLAAMLREKFASPQFHLIEADALAGKHALNPELLSAIQNAKSSGKTIRLVANLPYNIASPLIIEMLIAGVDDLTFTVQKEVAGRLRATAGSEDYGPLSIIAQMLATVEILRTLPPQAFWPAPKIDSALVRMQRVDRLAGQAGTFGNFVHQLFSSRRKMLRKALLQAQVDAEKILAQVGISGQIRPEELTPDDCFKIFTVAFPQK